MHVDNSACNLASINLLKFLKPNNTFNVPAFIKTIQIMILAQEIIVGGASYPTPKIAQNTEDLRQLGLGFANLGALIMALGFPYDSQEARALAGAITALMCGEAYRYSAEIARRMGPFNGFALNREPMLKIMRKHQQNVSGINKNALYDKVILYAAVTAWKEAIRLGERYGYRNSQVTVIAPTGTIAFMMDCDTTGIEPEFALMKTKQLMGGGSMRIVNQTVRRALVYLGYTPRQREEIARWIEEKGTAEGAPAIKEKHVAVFDTAIPPAGGAGGARAISWQGHVKMTAAVQPFISGAISKTFNMPAESTAEDIADAYMLGWKLGLKAFAVYRDGSKATQPLAVASSRTRPAGVEENETSINLISRASHPTRRHLPATRTSFTHKFVISGHEGYLTYSTFEEGALAEIFIRMAKQGSTLAGLLDAFAITVSTALQYGVPLRQLAQKFIYGRYEPAGVTENPDILFATSITDYIFRYLAFAFLGPDDLADLGIAAHSVASKTEQTVSLPVGEKKVAHQIESNLVVRGGQESLREEAVVQTFFIESLCRLCGGTLVRTGSCRTCTQCGTSDGGC
jgi:ribonucleoside-diphosphate reductase alpha chain